MQLYSSLTYCNDAPYNAKELIISLILAIHNKMDNCVIEFYRKMIKLSTDPVVEMGWN